MSDLQGLRQISPGNENEMLVGNEFLELGTAHQVEIVLSPLRAPIGMIESSALHLGVVVSEMDDELIATRGEGLEHFLVGIEPLRLGDAGHNFEDLVENDGAGFEGKTIKV
jgi:hypothetical protein